MLTLFIILFVLVFILALYASFKVVDEDERKEQHWNEYMELHKDYKR